MCLGLIGLAAVVSSAECLRSGAELGCLPHHTLGYASLPDLLKSQLPALCLQAVLVAVPTSGDDDDGAVLVLHVAFYAYLSPAGVLLWIVQTALPARWRRWQRVRALWVCPPLPLSC